MGSALLFCSSCNDDRVECNNDPVAGQVFSTELSEHTYSYSWSAANESLIVCDFYYNYRYFTLCTRHNDSDSVLILDLPRGSREISSSNDIAVIDQLSNLNVYTYESGYDRAYSIPGRWAYFSWVGGELDFVAWNNELFRLQIVNAITLDVKHDITVDGVVRSPKVSPGHDLLAYTVVREGRSFLELYSLLGDSIYSTEYFGEAIMSSICWIDSSSLLVAFGSALSKYSICNDKTTVAELDLSEGFVNLERILDERFLVETRLYCIPLHPNRYIGKLYIYDLAANVIQPYSLRWR